MSLGNKKKKEKQSAKFKKESVFIKIVCFENYENFRKENK